MDYNTRLQLEEELRKRLVCLSNVGNTTADKCAAEAVNFIHDVVQRYITAEETTPNGESVDEDGIRWMKRPEGVPSHFHYLYWSEDPDDPKPYRSWINTEKPREPGVGSKSNWASTGEYEELLKNYVNDVYEVVPKEGNVPINQIRRFYD